MDEGTNTLITHPSTTDLRNLAALSTTSSQTVDTEFSSNNVASGSDRSASRESCNNSLQRSASSPDLHARRRNAKAKPRAAREPTRASPIVAFSAGFCALKYYTQIINTHTIIYTNSLL